MEYKHITDLSVGFQNARYFIVHGDRPRVSGYGRAASIVHLKNAVCRGAPCAGNTYRKRQDYFLILENVQRKN